MTRYRNSARPVTPIRIFMPTEDPNMRTREAINRAVYCCVTNTRKLASRVFLSSMKILEYQAKAILARHGVPVPRGEVAFSAAEAGGVARRLGTNVVVVKAQ